MVIHGYTKKVVALALCVFMCLGLNSCAVYSSANMARIHSDSVTVLGPWGYIKTGANTAITLYTGRQAASKDAPAKIDWPQIQTIQEDSNANLNIGKPAKNLPTAKVVVPEESQSGIIDAAAKMMTK